MIICIPSRYIGAVVLSINIGVAAQPSLHGSVHQSNPVLIPASGESWIMHLSRTFNCAPMGKAGALGPIEADVLQMLKRSQL